MRPNNPTAQDIPLNIVGSNQFGRYKKISDESTYNMIISDNWLVDYAGYKKVLFFNPDLKGRGIFSSFKNDKLVVVIGNVVYVVETNLNFTAVGSLRTYSGDVSMAENNNNQLLISDSSRLYVYNFSSGNFATSGEDFTIDFTPGYITFQNDRFISPALGTNNWWLSIVGQLNINSSDWPTDNTGAIETKPDNAVATVRVPGRGNLLYVFGNTVTEVWYNVADPLLFPYTRSTTINIDYGCISSNTIAANDNLICWLGYNEKSGPVIMASSGADIQQLSNDGINFKLAKLVNPALSYGFLFKQDGHLFYQLTFPDPEDNFTLIYDFNTKLFFYATDENMNYHIAQDVAYFGNTTYFVSINDGSLYQMSTDFTDYDYTNPSISNPVEDVREIPRVRVCKPIRLKDSSYFVCNSITFTIEQGNDPFYPGTLLRVITTESGSPLSVEASSPDYYREIGTERRVDPYVPRIDLSVSRDGAESFSNYSLKSLNPLGKRKNRLVYWGAGIANDLSIQLRFWGKYRYVIGEGIVSVYQ